MYAKPLTVLLIAKHQNQNANLYVLNQIVIGNVLNHYAQNLNVNLFVKTQHADLRYIIKLQKDRMLQM